MKDMRNEVDAAARRLTDEAIARQRDPESFTLADTCRQLALDLADVERDRDRLHAALSLIAIQPVHITGLSEGCEGCARTAQQALDGADFTDLLKSLGTEDQEDP